MFLALGHVIAGEQQVIDDGIGAGPGAEQVVALEKGVVAVGGMGDDQRLHHGGVLLHEVGDAGVGIDDDFVSQSHLTTPVILLGQHELFTVRPVLVAQRHSHRGIGVHHLFGGDDLDLVWVGVQTKLIGGDVADDLVVAFQHRERPFGGVGNQSRRVHDTRLLNNSRKTG